MMTRQDYIKIAAILAETRKMMTRQDYIKIAAILAETRELAKARTVQYGPHTAIDHITRELADLMAAGNPGFDRARFYAAAGLDPKFPGFPSGTFPVQS